MAESAEILKHIQEAQASEDPAKEINDLVEPKAETPLVIPTAARSRRTAFRDQLQEKLKSRGQEVDLPEPSAEIVEFYHILASEGYDVAPHVSVDGGKKEATYAVLERVVRPEYADGTQMYYPTPEGGTIDPLADILKDGRVNRRIAITDWTRNVPHNSRFGVTWDEIDRYVAPEVAKTPALAAQMTKGGIVLHVPTKAEFQSAGKDYPHFGQANTWEWAYDEARFGRRLVVGRRGRGGLQAVDVWRSGIRRDVIGFRLQGKSPSQKLPR